jgi:hypothetical protein
MSPKSRNPASLAVHVAVDDLRRKLRQLRSGNPFEPFEHGFSERSAAGSDQRQEWLYLPYVLHVPYQIAPGRMGMNEITKRLIKRGNALPDVAAQLG